MLIEESQKDAENYEDNANHSVKANNKEIKEADMLLATAIAPQQVQVSRGLGSQRSMVVLQTSTHIDQGVTHLEVSKFVESMKTFITAGFRGVVPPKVVWIYVTPFLASSWWASMKSSGVQDKALEKILQALIDKIALLCPVHQRRIEFLKESRNISSLTDFLQRLEERIELKEFETLTKESLLSPIFLE